MKRNASGRTLVAVLLLTALTGAVSASEIYRWTDENGNVHYTDKPIDQASERLDIQSRPTDNEAILANNQARLERQATAEEAEAASQAEAPSREELMAERKQRRTQCDKYTERLTRFMQNRHLYREDSAGERTYLDDAEMADVREKTQAKVDEYCSS